MSQKRSDVPPHEELMHNIKNKYQFILAASKRARMLVAGAPTKKDENGREMNDFQVSRSSLFNKWCANINDVSSCVAYSGLVVDHACVSRLQRNTICDFLDLDSARCRTCPRQNLVGAISHGFLETPDPV